MRSFFQNRIVYGVSGACACLLALFFTPSLSSSVPVCLALAAGGLVCLRRWELKPDRANGLWRALLLLAALACGVFFAHRALGRTALTGPARLGAGAAAAAVSTFYFHRTFSLLAGAVPAGREAVGMPVRTDRGERLFLLITAAAVITVCSKSSPLYPFNDWVDANCFFTVGKSMLHGRVLYRDIYEQKGILLYVLHGLAYLVSGRSFLGVWMLEIAAAFFFLFYSYKTLRLFAPKSSLAMIPLLAGTVYSLPSFCHGDSAEELCLPLLMYALYVGVRAVVTRVEISRREWLWVGITAGCVLWIKFSLAGFYLGWILVPLLRVLRRRDGRALGRMIGWGLLGLAVTTGPVLVYFALHRALGDLATAYFYNNIFLYHRESAPSLSRFRLNLNDSFQYSALVYSAVLLSAPLFLGRRSLPLAAQAFLPMGTLCLVIFSSTKPYIYYSLALSVFAVFFFVLPAKLSENTGRWTVPAAAALSALLIACNCGNFYFLSYDKEDLPQYQFDRVLSRYDAPTLLNYGFLDGGFYTVSGIVPSEKYFCTLNLPLPEMSEEQEQCLREGRVDFVVTRDRPLDLPLYRCVDEADVFFEGRDWTYRLYIRADLAE